MKPDYFDGYVFSVIHKLDVLEQKSLLLSNEFDVSNEAHIASVGKVIAINMVHSIIMMTLNRDKASSGDKGGK